MINSVDQYQFVTGANIDVAHPHGDLDRILINGEIMPLRSEGHKRDLRGEDIAFLFESCSERRGLEKPEYNPPVSTFSRKVSGSQLSDIAYHVDDLTYLDCNHYWVKNIEDIPNFIEVQEERFAYTNLYEVLADRMFQRDEFITRREQVSNRVLLRSDVENMFSDIEKIKHVINYVGHLEETGFQINDLGSDWGPQQPNYPTSATYPWYHMMNALLQDSPELWDTIANPYYEVTKSYKDKVFSNPYSKSSFLMYRFKFSIWDYGQDEPTWRTVFAKSNFSSDDGKGNYTLKGTDLISAAKNALTNGLGITLRPLPVRQYMGRLDYQEITLEDTGINCISELRDRTRW